MEKQTNPLVIEEPKAHLVKPKNRVYKDVIDPKSETIVRFSASTEKRCNKLIEEYFNN